MSRGLTHFWNRPTRRRAPVLPRTSGARGRPWRVTSRERWPGRAARSPSRPPPTGRWETWRRCGRRPGLCLACHGRGSVQGQARGAHRLRNAKGEIVCIIFLFFLRAGVRPIGGLVDHQPPRKLFTTSFSRSTLPVHFWKGTREDAHQCVRVFATRSAAWELGGVAAEEKYKGLRDGKKRKKKEKKEATLWVGCPDLPRVPSTSTLHTVRAASNAKRSKLPMGAGPVPAGGENDRAAVQGAAAAANKQTKMANAGFARACTHATLVTHSTPLLPWHVLPPVRGADQCLPRPCPAPNQKAATRPHLGAIFSDQGGPRPGGGEGGGGPLPFPASIWGEGRDRPPRPAQPSPQPQSKAGRGA